MSTTQHADPQTIRDAAARPVEECAIQSAARSTAAPPGTPVSSAPILELSRVSKRFDANAAQPVLQSVDLSVARGEFVAIVGASGCGKSTLLRLVAGLDAQDEGQITFAGAAVRDTSLERGIVFQDHRLFPWLNVEQNIAVALRNSPLSRRRQREAVTAHIELVGLTGHAGHFPHQLSGGMAQRVAIARGLVNRPALLLLDEPFGALDALTRARMQQELHRIWQAENITMVLVTHDVDEAVFLADRIVVMKPGPGRIARIVDVAVPRPRRRTDPEVGALRDDILSDFSEP